jgi:1,4-alpha-glucan branching enzyme
VDAYNFLGAHPVEEGGELKWHFSVWAPNAMRVSLVGEFCGWDREAYPMEKQYDGIWELRLPDALFNPNRDPERYGTPEAAELLRTYKYAVLCANGEWHMRADPYGFEMELRPSNGSKLRNISDYKWNDGEWMEGRKGKTPLRGPMNIYEMHLGTWRRGENGRILNYAEIADQLVPYLQDMGYTQVEFMPVMEHPFDGSWGYQVIGYYAPTSRYGTPDQFRYLVDALHRAGIAVILDWVPAHFPKDEAGLRLFDGTACYEHADSRRAEMPQWGTLLFDYARGESESFLLSNALFWLKEYHADGIRVDGVTSMLYLNFGVEDPARKKFNEKGTEEDLEAIEFIRSLNKTVGKACPDVMMIAEESAAWPLVTYPPEDGGLGFHYKWDMGWMHDTLHYMQADFPFRPGAHHLLTFSMMYCFNENFVLALSHDEVVHGKASLIGRMPGDYWRQFAGLRVLAIYQMTHPGAKHNFMGSEIAQFIEWRYYEGLEWFLLDYETHSRHRDYIKALNAFYLKEKALWQQSYTWDGFQWIDADNKEQSILVYLRKAKRPIDDLVVVLSFVPEVYDEYRVGVPRKGVYREVFNSDAEEFGGSGRINRGPLEAEPVPWQGQPWSVVLKTPPIGGTILKRMGRKETAEKKDKAETH